MTATAEAPESSHDARRIRLVLSRWIGGGYVCYFVVCFFQMAPNAVIVAWWWTPTAVALAFGPGWILLASTFVKTSPRLRETLSLACGAGYLTAIALWFVAWNGGTLSTDNATWLVLFPGLASLALVVGARPWLACPHLVVAVVSAFYASTLTDETPDSVLVLVGSVGWAIAFSAVFVAAGIMAVRTGEALDDSRERTYRLAADAAAQEARNQQRVRYDALVHDHVLAIMLNVPSGPADLDIAAQARQVMVELDDALTDAPRQPVAASGLSAVIRATIADLGSSIPVVANDDPSDCDDFAVPGGVADALAQAAAEAVRNSLRHAGRAATIGVSVVATCREIAVTVEDNGCGFDIGAVRRDRMGIEVSIRDRMTAVGGSARVSSSPGVGTLVVVEWHT